jgi:hypothetical protein
VGKNMKKMMIVCTIIELFCFQFYINCFAQGHKQNSFCKLFNSDKNSGQNIITQAVLYTLPNTDEYFYSFNCNNRDYFALADFSNTSNLSILQDRLKKLPEEKTQNRFLLTIEGRFYVSLPPEYGNLSYLRAKIEVNKIMSLKLLPPSNKLPNSNGKAFILDSVKSLEATNTELIFSLYKSNFKNSDVVNLVTNNTKISINKKSVSKEKFLTETFIENDKSLVLKISAITRKGHIWKVTGEVLNKLKDNAVEKMKYEIKYQLNKNDSWELVLFVVDFKE